MQKETLNRIILWAFAGLVLVGSVFALASLASRNSAPKTYPVTQSLTGNEIEKGDRNPKAVIVEYSDFQCPACRSYNAALKQLDAKELDKVRFVYRHFPLPGHQNARPAAQAAEAARAQGKFWEMHDLLFEKQNTWAESSDAKKLFIEYAKELKLNLEQFEKDYNSEATKKKINDDISSGFLFDVNSTPSFFINDVKMPTPKNFDEFKQNIKNAYNSTQN